MTDATYNPWEIAVSECPYTCLFATANATYNPWEIAFSECPYTCLLATANIVRGIHCYNQATAVKFVCYCTSN